jgi:hypothetical protein
LSVATEIFLCNWIDFNITPSDFYNAISKHRFTMCPWGNGLDTHRIYEGGSLLGLPATLYYPHLTYHLTFIFLALTSYFVLCLSLAPAVLRWAGLAVLAMGGIPVLKRSSINSCIDDSDNNISVTVVSPVDGSAHITSVQRGSIPVVIVRSWTEVTSALLEARWAEFTQEGAGRRWDYSRLTMQHWAQRILGDGFSSNAVSADQITY